MLKCTDDSIDILQLKFDDIIEHPNRWIIIMDLLCCVLELWFVGLGRYEKVWVDCVFLLLYWRLLRSIFTLFLRLLFRFRTTFTVYFLQDRRLLLEFSAIEPVRKHVFVLRKQCLIQFTNSPDILRLKISQSSKRIFKLKQLNLFFPKIIFKLLKYKRRLFFLILNDETITINYSFCEY